MKVHWKDCEMRVRELEDKDGAMIAGIEQHRGVRN